MFKRVVTLPSEHCALGDALLQPRPHYRLLRHADKETEAEHDTHAAKILSNAVCQQVEAQPVVDATRPQRLVANLSFKLIQRCTAGKLGLITGSRSSELGDLVNI